MMQKSTDVLRRIIAPCGGQGGVTLSNMSPHCHRFPIEDYISWVSKGTGKKCNWWCTAIGGQYNWRDPNRVLVMRYSADSGEAKVFGALVPQQSACEHLLYAVKLPANQQTRGDSPVQVLVEGLQEQRRGR